MPSGFEATFGGTPVVLIYRGPAATDDCAHSAAVMIRRHAPEALVRFVGPAEDEDLGPAVLAGADLWVQPGGGTLKPAWRRLRRHADVMRGFVESGGGYLGLCLGGYLAGRTPGFGLFPGDTDRYARSRGSEIRHTDDATLEVNWRGGPRPLFFQDGPQFLLDDPQDPDVEILARYRSGAVAAFRAGVGKGQVVCVGPHPEADARWFSAAGLPVPHQSGADLAQDVVDVALRRRRGGLTARHAASA